MAEERIIKKINVRSPYYVNVVNRSDETQDEIDPTPTEPLVNNFTHECGDTVSIGATSDRNIYKISLTNRGTGTFTINFSNLKVPIKYRFGIEGSLPSFQTSNGINLYEPIWLSETGETVSLSDAIANPNGVSQAITYDVTQSDLDSGNKLVLEIFHPVTSAGYSFASVCQDIQAADDIDQVSVPSVLIATVIARETGYGYSGITVGGKSITTSFIPSQMTKRYIFSDASLAVTPTNPNSSFFKDASLPRGTGNTWNDMTNEYVGAPLLSSLVSDTSAQGINIFVPSLKGSFGNEWDVDIIISRHAVYQDAQNNWKFKTWADLDLNNTVQAVKVNLNTSGYCSSWTDTQLQLNVELKVTNDTPLESATIRPISKVRCFQSTSTHSTRILDGSYPIIQDA